MWPVRTASLSNTWVVGSVAQRVLFFLARGPPTSPKAADKKLPSQEHVCLFPPPLPYPRRKGADG